MSVLQVRGCRHRDVHRVTHLAEGLPLAEEVQELVMTCAAAQKPAVVTKQTACAAPGPRPTRAPPPDCSHDS